MHTFYEDILSRIGEDPKWFDEAAVPRFCDFSPREVADIYADEVALVGIACQSCQHKFRVAFSRGPVDEMLKPGSRSIADAIRANTIHYGDPPNIMCCAAGPTMNSEPGRVLEYWIRENFDWVRDASLEIDL